MEQPTVLQTDWNEYFNEAVTSYTEACFMGSTRSAVERVIAAEKFCALIACFQDGGDYASKMLEHVLSTDVDGYRRAVAARLLTEMPIPSAQGFLLNLFINSPNPMLSLKHLYQLGYNLPLWQGWEQAWQWVKSAHPAARTLLTSALLRKESEKGRTFVEEAINYGDYWILSGVVKGLSNWKEPSWLVRMLRDTPSKASTAFATVQLDAAFYLGLEGHEIGLTHLYSIATQEDRKLGIEAVQRLAWLAQPESVQLVDQFLRSDDPEIVTLALVSAGSLCAAELLPTLISLLGRASDFRCVEFGVPVANEASRLLLHLTGKSLPDDEIEYVVGAFEDVFTELTLKKAALYYQNMLPDFVPEQRYFFGKPITLRMLAEDLISPHQGPQQVAAYNLRAICEVDFGFDPENDLVANLPAIKAWREYCNLPEVQSLGCWATKRFSKTFAVE